MGNFCSNDDDDSSAPAMQRQNLHLSREKPVFMYFGIHGKAEPIRMLLH